jgi:hypothetical protein
MSFLAQKNIGFKQKPGLKRFFTNGFLTANVANGALFFGKK